MSRTAPRRVAAGISAVALAAGVLATTSPAEAAPDDTVTVMQDLVTPLSLAVGNDRTVYVSQNFAGVLTRKRPGRKPRTIFTPSVPGTEVGAVSVRHGVVVFATTAPMEEPPARLSGRFAGGAWLHRTATQGTTTADEDNWLYRIGRSGRPRKVANLSRHERRKNPDGDVTYGVRGISEECAAEFPAEVPATYTGIVESHPYATYQTRRKTYVADAAANAILSVNREGRVRTVGVLPGSSITITEDLAGAFGIPECAVGEKYWFEPVPTDVEQVSRRTLAVTTLPGGPEDPSLGARGSIFRVDARSGATRRIAKGLMSPTGLAVGNGFFLVAELFANRISLVEFGSRVPQRWRRVSMPGDVEFGRAGIHWTSDVLSEPPAGKVQRWRP